MNKVMLIGRFTKDPILSFIPGSGTSTCKVTMAIDRYNASTKKKEADFVQCVFWGKQAEAVSTYMAKGKLIAICGSIRTKSYPGKDGVKRYTTEVYVSEMQFLEKKAEGVNPNQNPFGGDNPFGGNSYDEDMTPVDDDDIPF